MTKKTKPQEAPWTTRPISTTCEKITARGVAGTHEMECFCGKPTSYAYPAMGGGWMALCEEHGKKHLPHISPIADLIKSGETFEGADL